MTDSNSLSKHEIVQRGKQLYQSKLQADAERDHLGKFIVVDVHSGDHEIDASAGEAARRILERRPGAILYLVRIGEKVAYRFGFGRTAGIR